MLGQRVTMNGTASERMTCKGPQKLTCEVDLNSGTLETQGGALQGNGVTRAWA